MSLREKLQKNPSITAGLAGVVLVVAIVSIVWQARDGGMVAGGAYYTDDDGQTLFTDEGTKIVPFDRGGKQAVRAHVFMCGGKQVVGYLSKYTDDAVQALADVPAARAEKRQPKNMGALMSLGTTGTQIKKPGAGNLWLNGNDPKAIELRIFKCPGERQSAQEVRP